MTEHIVAFAGGVGGAKLADGLARVLSPESLTIVVNTGDDFIHWGLNISPDLDTVCYTLAGLANSETGWGRASETWHTFAAMQILGAPDWFRLGDQDLATHLERTRRLRAGEPLSFVTRDLCRAWGIAYSILPMSDQPVSTIVDTVEHGELAFQEYFVHQHCEPRVKGFRFEGIERAEPTPGLLESIERADAIVFCPSNPWVSIDPILSLRGVREAVAKKTVVAVSPIIGGETVKGPAAKMYEELGIVPSALAVARHYGSLLSGFVIDEVDVVLKGEVEKAGSIPLVTKTLMKNINDRIALAEDVLNFTERLLR